MIIIIYTNIISMPGMVGGFLRRDINYLNINYKYFFIYNYIFAWGNKIRAGLFSVLLPNEVMVKGLMNRRNSQINLKEKSKRSLDCVIYISLMKMNFHFKIDSPTVVWVDYELRIYGKDISRIRDIIIASLSNIKTGKNLYHIQISISILKNTYFNEIISQHGNLGNYILYTIYNLNEHKYKPYAFVEYMKQNNYLILCLNLHSIQVNTLDLCNRDGGKIVEKANAESNFSDIRIKSTSFTKCREVGLNF